MANYIKPDTSVIWIGDGIEKGVLEGYRSNGSGTGGQGSAIGGRFGGWRAYVKIEGNVFAIPLYPSSIFKDTEKNRKILEGQYAAIMAARAKRKLQK